MSSWLTPLFSLQELSQCVELSGCRELNADNASFSAQQLPFDNLPSFPRRRLFNSLQFSVPFDSSPSSILLSVQLFLPQNSLSTFPILPLHLLSHSKEPQTVLTSFPFLCTPSLSKTKTKTKTKTIKIHWLVQFWDNTKPHKRWIFPSLIIIYSDPYITMLT